MPDHHQAVQIFDDATGDIALGELDAAIAKYQECIRLDPEYFDAWHALGMALMKAGRFPEAIQAGLRAVELNPDDQLAWSSLSIFYVRNGQVPEAEAAGAKARILSWGGKIKKDSAEREVFFYHHGDRLYQCCAAYWACVREDPRRRHRSLSPPQRRAHLLSHRSRSTRSESAAGCAEGRGASGGIRRRDNHEVRRPLEET